jgi:hypothetical protein
VSGARSQALSVKGFMNNVAPISGLQLWQGLDELRVALICDYQ